MAPFVRGCRSGSGALSEGPQSEGHIARVMARSVAEDGMVGQVLGHHPKVRARVGVRGTRKYDDSNLTSGQCAHRLSPPTVADPTLPSPGPGDAGTGRAVVVAARRVGLLGLLCGAGHRGVAGPGVGLLE